MVVEGKEKALALAAHISYMFFGIGYIGIPLVIYLLNDGKNDFVAGHAKQALKVQAILGVLGAVTMVLTFLVVGVFFWPIIVILGLLWFFCSIYACFKVINGEEYHYPLL